MRLPRRGHLVQAIAAMLPVTPLPSIAVPPNFLGGPIDAVILPLYRCGAAFCTEYRVDGQRFRAVADTGSPFLLVLDRGGCGPNAGPERWGCFEPRVSAALGDSSEEGFGGQDMGVSWRRGAVQLSSIRDSKYALLDRRRGARAGPWTDAEAPSLSFEPINFGVVTSVEAKGGSGALYLGLAKYRQPRVRPTFLEQTDIAAMRFDFSARTLVLAKRPVLRALVIRFLYLPLQILHPRLSFCASLTLLPSPSLPLSPAASQMALQMKPPASPLAVSSSPDLAAVPLTLAH